MIENLEDDDWRKPLVDYLQDPNGSAPKKIRLQALDFVIIGDDLYKKKAVDGSLLTCLGKDESKIAIREVHDRICGAYQVGDKIRWTLLRRRFYWPKMGEECLKFAKCCEECQKRIPIQHVPASELHSIIKPWPFQGWALDLIGQIYPPSLKKHKYILVAVDYFSKWVEAIPLKEVT